MNCPVAGDDFVMVHNEEDYPCETPSRVLLYGDVLQEVIVSGATAARDAGIQLHSMLNSAIKNIQEVGEMVMQDFISMSTMNIDRGFHNYY